MITMEYKQEEHVSTTPLPQVDDKDINLYKIMLEHCDKQEDEDIKKILIAELSSLENEDSLKQKILLNRYLSNLLFRFRYKYKVPVIYVLPFLLLKGTNGDWLTCYIDFVYPFLKEQRVFELLYKI